MAMGKKKRRQQKDLWVATSEMPVPPGHPFYVALGISDLQKHQFDDFVERRCAQFDAPRMGRPTLFGPKLSARRFDNQRVEAIIKCEVLNRMSSRGMPESVRIR